MKSVDIARDVAEGRVHGRIVIPVDTTVTVTATGSADAFGSVVLSDLPTGQIFLSQAKATLQFNTTDADPSAVWEGDFSIGSAPTADVTLSGAEVDIVPSTPVGPAVAKLSPVTTGRLAAAVMIDNINGAGEINLNFKVDNALIADASSAIFTVKGVVVLMLGFIP